MASEELDQRRERERDLDRLLTFVDAIVAIAITLLVLPLVDLAGEAEQHDSVVDLLRDNSGTLWAFVISFLVISRLWFAQHRSVHNLVADYRPVSLLLVTWSLTIVFLPFPTALIPGAGDDAMTKVLYIGTMALSTGIITVIDILISRHPEITDGTDNVDPWDAIVTTALFVVALVISVVFPETSYWPLLLLACAAWVAKPLQVRFGSVFEK